MNKAAIASYGRSLLATALGAIFAIGKLPFDFTEADWRGVMNAVWIAAIPVLIRALNPKDEAFGVHPTTPTK